MAEAHLWRVLIIERVQRERPAKVIEYLNHKLAKDQEVIKKHQETVKVLAQERIYEGLTQYDGVGGVNS